MTADLLRVPDCRVPAGGRVNDCPHRAERDQAVEHLRRLVEIDLMVTTTAPDGTTAARHLQWFADAADFLASIAGGGVNDPLVDVIRTHRRVFNLGCWCGDRGEYEPHLAAVIREVIRVDVPDGYYAKVADA
jgi:hypothetical protein